MALMRENPRVREWWSMTDSYQEASLRACLYPNYRGSRQWNCVGGNLTWLFVVGCGPAPTELGSGSAKQRSRRAIMVETARRGLLSSMMKRPVGGWRERWHSAFSLKQMYNTFILATRLPVSRDHRHLWRQQQLLLRGLPTVCRDCRSSRPTCLRGHPPPPLSRPVSRATAGENRGRGPPHPRRCCHFDLVIVKREKVLVRVVMLVGPTKRRGRWWKRKRLISARRS